MITIEKGIPIPQEHEPTPTRAACLEAMRQMEVGDSFVYLPGYYEEIRRAAEIVGIYVTTRSHYDEAGKKIGWRVWRVSEPTRKSLAARKRLTPEFRKAA